MGNSIKRHRRAKQKAKSAKVHKQHQLELKNLVRDVASVSPELEIFFESLLDYDDDLASLLPVMKQFISRTRTTSSEIMADTAILFSLFMWWKHHPSEAVYVPTIVEVADLLVIQPEFQAYFT